tara:strand:- start:1206 stop:2099 length:894 start_codon:yes stop_codon:yes gene_type:complete
MLAYVSAAFYLADRLTHTKRQRVQGTPIDLGLHFQDVQFLTFDRLTLNGWFVKSPEARATVVLVHDRLGTRADVEQGLLKLHGDYVRHGFNVLSFDLRGRGESSGCRDHLGSREHHDLDAALDYLWKQENQLPVVLHGFGFGAALAIKVASRRSGIAGIIADSPVASVREMLRFQHSHIPAYMFETVHWFARWFFDADLDELKPIDIINQVEAPVLLLCAEIDNEVPESHALNLAAASLNRDHQIWVAPQHKGHCSYYIQHSVEYVNRSVSFINHVVPIRILPVTSDLAEARPTRAS